MSTNDITNKGCTAVPVQIIYSSSGIIKFQQRSMGFIRKYLCNLEIKIEINYHKLIAS